MSQSPAPAAPGPSTPRRRRSPAQLWRRRDRIVLVLLRRMPSGPRRAVARRVATATERALGSRPGSARLPQVAFGAWWLAGDRAPAETLARRVASDQRSSAHARRRLATMAGDAGYLGIVRELVLAAGDDPSPVFEAERARLAMEEGRYRDAVAHAQRAADGGAPAGPSLLAQAESFLVVTDPGWLPAVKGDVRAARHAAARPVAGRVLHVVAVSLPHRQVGYTVRTQSVARCQLAAGLDPHVLTRAGFPGLDGIHGVPRREHVDGIPYHHPHPEHTTGGRLDRTIARTASDALRLVETLRPAVLQPHTNHVQAQAALAVRRETGTPVVYEVRGFWEESWAARQEGDDETAMDTERYTRMRDVETAAMRAADAVVTLSGTMRDEIVERGAAADRVVIVPNAVDLERFTPAPRDDALAARLGIGHRDPVAGYVTSLTAYEGIPGFLEAAAIVRRGMPALRVLLVGEGPEEATIREAAARLGLDDGALVMPGRVPHADIARYYGLIDVFVVPRTASRVSRLVTPLKPFEAMALERAVVVSDLPALREIVTPGETGETFRADDPADLARVLGGLLEDEGLRRRLGANAREWVTANRTWASNGARYRELFERLGVA